MRQIFIVFIFVLFLTACNVNETQLQRVIVNNGHNLSVDAKCTWVIGDQGAWLPDPVCSPGSAFPLETIQINGEYAKTPGGAIVGDICKPGYSSNIRDVSQKTKEEVYANYGVMSRKPGEYEMDHIIALSLGGTNDVKNLYPQPALPKPGFHEKDIIESCFHRAVCSGKLDLQTAQYVIAINWTQGLSYCKVSRNDGWDQGTGAWG